MLPLPDEEISGKGSSGLSAIETTVILVKTFKKSSACLSKGWKLSVMTIEDILDLEKRYNEAKLALGEITYVSYYPQYPAVVSDFMSSLCIDPWFAGAKYDRSKIGDILLNIKSATLEDVCCVLVGAGREERFCDGGWKSILQSDQLQPAINRLKELSHPCDNSRGITR